MSHDTVGSMSKLGTQFSGRAYLSTRLHRRFTETERQSNASIQNDPVNHPSHYTNHPSGVECITVVEHMNFNLGNAMKYIWRAGEKGNLIEDLQKARWYLTRELQRLGAK